MFPMVADESPEGEPEFDACEAGGEAFEPDVRHTIAPFGQELVTTLRRVDADAAAVDTVRRSP
jgi:hypothetical protein